MHGDLQCAQGPAAYPGTCSVHRNLQRAQGPTVCTGTRSVHSHELPSLGSLEVLGSVES